MSEWDSRVDSIHGCLLGTAIGDTLGLPYEGLSRQTAKRMLGPPDRYRFCFGRGMVSDDTDHALMTAAALLEAKRKPDDSDGEAEMAAVPKSGRWEGFRAKKPWLHRSHDCRDRFELEWFEVSLARQLKWWLASIPAGDRNKGRIAKRGHSEFPDRYVGERHQRSANRAIDGVERLIRCGVSSWRRGPAS